MSFNFTSFAAFRRLSTAILVALTACSTAFAQITVTNATFPTAGTTLRTAFASNPGIAASVFTPPGGNQVWDLSGLQQGTVKTTVFKAASEGSQGANVPGAELVSTSSSSPVREEYYNVTSSRFETQASYNYFYDVVPLYLAKNSPAIAERYAPLNFFDIQQSSSSILGGNCITIGTDVDGSPLLECGFSPSDFPPTLMAQLSALTNGVTIEKLRYRVTISRVDVVDAYGTMSIPGGTYPVLRMKRTEYKEVSMDAKIPALGWSDITDNATQAGFQGMGVCTTYVYHFINDVEKEPIAVVSTICDYCPSVSIDCGQAPISTVEYKLVAPLLSINNVTLNEGNSGTTNFNFTVSLSAPAPAGGVSFDISTQDGTTNPATQPSDYTAKSLTSQTIPAGSSTYNFTVAVNGDVDVEPDETFFVNVSNVTGAVLDDGQGLGTITNDDVAPVLTIVTVTTSPVGRNITVDGTTYIAPQTFNWTPGSNHTIATTTPQAGTSGTRYVFNNWSDAGAISHTIISPSVATTFTASFTTQYSLSTATSPSNGGSILPVSGNFFDAGTVIPVSAIANSGFALDRFSGGLTGATNPQDLTMDGPKSVTANFVAVTGITIASFPVGRSIVVDGTTYTAPQTFNWTPGSSHTIATTSPQAGTTGIRYVFNNWSDGGAISHNIIAPSVATTLTANFDTEYQLTTSAGTGGSILPASGNFYAAGSVVSVSATANAGFNFSGFGGDLTGTTNPQNLTMNGSKSVTAQFDALPPPPAVCPQSPDYWKNNPSAWPGAALPMQLGTSRTYTKQQLRNIINAPVKGDASLILAKQLISAKLNIAAGATAPASVTSAITAADAAIGTRLIPMNVRTNTTLGKTMTSLAKTLESFNTGQLTTGCSTLLTTSGLSNGVSMNVVPENFELEQNYPNPFSSVTTIRYVVPVESTVSLAVYNNQGQLMAKLADGLMRAGNYQVQFDASKLAAGIYLYRLQTIDANGQVVLINKKMILSK